MRIGIDGHMLEDHSGGNESYYRNILQNMEVSDKDEIFLFIRKGTDISKYTKFKIIEFTCKNSFLRNFLELSLLCFKYKLDVLHTQYFIPFIRPCKVVCTIHDICFEHYKDIFTKKEYITQKILIPYAARKSEFIFTVSENAKQDIADTYHVSSDKILVTYNAADEAFHRITGKDLNEEDLRKKFGIGDCRYILSVGNLQPRKNLPRLIQAYKQWKHRVQEKTSEFNDVKLVIVGKKAWMYDDILKSAISNSKTQDVILTDYVSIEDLARLYNASYCFVYPSFFEGFGLPVIEAMACGTPVATSNVTSLPEVAGDAGIYFDPLSVDEISKSIDKLISDNELREKLVEKGYVQIQKFDWKKSAEIIMDVYKKCI